MNPRTLFLLRTCTVAFVFSQTFFYSCKPRAYNQSHSNSNSVDFLIPEHSTFFKPIEQWSGRLILPQPDQRASDGSVYLELRNAPPQYSHLVNTAKPLRLIWEEKNGDKDWVAETKFDVNFIQRTLDSEAKGNIHPRRINGWKGVHPLESLAGARPKDDMNVMLLDVEVRDEHGVPRIVTHKAPVQTEGTHVTLITIEKKENSILTVRYFNPQTLKFDGPQDHLSVQIPDKRPGQEFTSANIDGIENSSANSSGWYAYGEFEATTSGHRKFVVQALEPRILTSLSESIAEATPALKNVDFVNAGQNGQSYLSTENWRPQFLAGDSISRTLIESRPSLGMENGKFSAESKALWKEGDKGILVHLFGWRYKTPLGNNATSGEKMPALITGHFGYGIATVVKNPFVPGELKFDIDYKQIYGHNSEGIISGALKWNAYMGSLTRGWAYQLPVADAIVRFPALSATYQIGQNRIVPLDTVSHELEKMMARYRTGNGTGSAPINAVTSCVQDSTQSIFHVLQSFKTLQEQPETQKWLAEQGDSQATKEFKTLVNLQKRLNEFTLGMLPTPPDHWLAAEMGDFTLQNKLNNVQNIISALRTLSTVLPRNAFDNIISILMEQGAGVWMLHSAQIGGAYRALLEPMPADKGIDVLRMARTAK